MQEIWIINQYAITPDQPGGTRHYDFGVELVKAGYDVKVFAADVNLALRRHTRDLKGRLWMEEQVDGVLFEWVRTITYQRNNWRRALNAFNFSWNVYLAGLKQSTRPDVIIGSSPHLFAALSGYYLARRFGCRFIFEVRDLWPKALIDMKSISPGHPMILFMRRVEQKLYQNCDHIIVLAEGSIPYIKKKGIPEKKISYIPNGVHSNFFIPHKSREESRRLYGFERFTVVYTGAHGPANALDTILKAAEELKGNQEIEFVLIGDGPVKHDLQVQARAAGIKNIRFADPIPKGDIPNLLHAADAAVITLKDARAFYSAVSPNKLFDYLAAGRPVICSIPGEMARMVDKHGCGLISPAENGRALAEQVHHMFMLSPEEREGMGARGRELVLSRFSREKLVGKLIDIIDCM